MNNKELIVDWQAILERNGYKFIGLHQSNEYKEHYFSKGNVIVTLEEYS